MGSFTVYVSRTVAQASESRNFCFTIVQCDGYHARTHPYKSDVSQRITSASHYIRLSLSKYAHKFAEDLR